MPYGAMRMPLRQDVRCCGAANCPQLVYRLNLRPVRARRLSKVGRHWAPMIWQRATRMERHSGRTWPTYCNKPNWVPPYIDGLVRTVACSDRAVKPKTVSSADIFLDGHSRPLVTSGLSFEHPRPAPEIGTAPAIGRSTTGKSPR